MEEYLSKKYAQILDAEDIMDLFETITDVYGSIEKAAEKCEVARTTPYGWKKANYVKTITKIKVLKASLQANLIKTLNVLTKKSKNRTEDVLLTYINTIYQKAIDANNLDFEPLMNLFFVTSQEHYGLIRDVLEDEIALMTKTLAEKAIEVGITLPPDPLEQIDQGYMLEIIPDIVFDLAMKKMNPIDITNKYGVPLEIPLTIQDALDPIISSSTKLTTEPLSTPWVNYAELTAEAGMVTGVRRRNPYEPESPEVFRLIPVGR